MREGNGRKGSEEGGEWGGKCLMEEWDCEGGLGGGGGKGMGWI